MSVHDCIICFTIHETNKETDKQIQTERMKETDKWDNAFHICHLQRRLFFFGPRGRGYGKGLQNTNSGVVICK